VNPYTFEDTKLALIVELMQDVKPCPLWRNNIDVLPTPESPSITTFPRNLRLGAFLVALLIAS
jgi:hypothetical protein